MKKLMYAALFLGALSSCSDDNDVIENGGMSSLPAEDDKTVIALSVSNNNSFSVETRGIGMVGGLNETTNKWNGETLYILMTDSGDVAPVKPDYVYPGISEYILNNVKVTAPTGTAAGLVTAAETGHYYYYPTNGMFDFYGYHVDDAAGENPTPEVVEDSIVLNVTIDGSQDLMVAKADFKTDSTNATPSDWYEKSYKYSAYAARRGVQPTLKFNHLLTQLQFNVINKGTTTRMWVDSIGVESKNVAEMVVAGKNHGNIKWTGEKAMLYVKNDYDDADRVLDSLAKVPLFTEVDGEATIKTEKTKVGNLLVAASNYQELITTYTGHIILLQNLKVTDKDGDGNVIPAGRQEVIKDTVAFTVELPKEVQNPNFLAQHAYTVNITVYGLSMIEVTAELTRWENGGSFDIIPEDQETTGEDAVYKSPLIENAYFVTDRASYDLLPEAHKAKVPWNDNGSTEASLPWLVVSLTDSYTGDLSIKVQGPEYAGVAYNKTIEWTGLNDVTFFTLNNGADELNVTSITSGTWTVSVNGGDETEIVVPNN